MLVFVEGGKPENPEKNPRSKDENQQQTQPTCDADPGIEPGPHWWEAGALKTAPPLLPPGCFLIAIIVSLSDKLSTKRILQLDKLRLCSI